MDADAAKQGFTSAPSHPVEPDALVLPRRPWSSNLQGAWRQQPYQASHSATPSAMAQDSLGFTAQVWGGGNQPTFVSEDCALQYGSTATMEPILTQASSRFISEVGPSLPLAVPIEGVPSERCWVFQASYPGLCLPEGSERALEPTMKPRAKPWEPVKTTFVKVRHLAGTTTLSNLRFAEFDAPEEPKSLSKVVKIGIMARRQISSIP